MIKKIFRNSTNTIFISILSISAIVSIFPPSAYAQVFITQWGTQGASGNGQFNFPFGVAVNPTTGSVFVLDTGNNRVQKFTGSGDFIRTWGTFCNINTGEDCIAEDNLNVPSSLPTLPFPTPFPIVNGMSLPYSANQFQFPFALTVNPTNGIVYVADTFNHRIQAFTLTGQFAWGWGSIGTAQGQMMNPFGIAVNPTNGNVYVADTYNHRIQVFSSNGAFIASFGSLGTAPGAFNYPFGVAVNPTNGNVYVADTANSRIQQFSASGEFVNILGAFGTAQGQMMNPFGIAVNPTNGNVYVADTFNHRISEFTSAGAFIDAFGSLGSGEGQFAYPTRAAYNSITGEIFVSDTGNNRIQVFDLTS